MIEAKQETLSLFPQLTIADFKSKKERKRRRNIIQLRDIIKLEQLLL